MKIAIWREVDMSIFVDTPKIAGSAAIPDDGPVAKVLTWVDGQKRRLRTAEETVRRTATFPKITDDAIVEISDELGITVSATLNYLVAKGLIVEGIRAEGGVIQAVMPNGDRFVFEDDEGNKTVTALERRH
jgi:hypothetical protein